MQAARVATAFFCLMALGPASCRRPSPRATPTGLVGRLVAEGAEEKGVSDGTVTLWVDPDGRRVPLAKTQTKPDGSFVLANVPDGSYWLDVRAPGLVEQVIPVQAASTHGRDLGRLRIEKSRALAGRVIDRGDAPVPLAHVLVFVGGGTEGLPLRRIAETRADLDGRFTLEGLGRGPYRVLIEAPGLGAAEIPEAIITSDTVRIRIDAETGRVSGDVRESGRPVPGAVVWVYGELLADARVVDADGDGRFSLGGLGPGRYAVLARLGHRASRPALLTIREGDEPAAAVVLTLEPAEVQIGRVTDGAGRAAAGARVTVSEIRPGFFPLATTLDAGEDGTFATPALGPGSYRVAAAARGFVPSREARVEIAVGRHPPPVTLELSRAASVRGRILAESGEPTPGAVVRLLRPGFDQLAILSRALPPAAEAASSVPDRTFDVAARLMATRSEPDGHFAFAAVAAGAFRLEVLAPGHRPWRSPIRTLVPGESQDQGEIHLAGTPVRAPASEKPSHAASPDGGGV